jgi:hypothetical protein
MEGKTVIPRTVSGFAEYIRNVYDVTQKNINVYKINSTEFAKITPLYTTYDNLEKLCANPATATKGNRDARNIAWVALEKQWRLFLNKEVRLNDSISIADKEIYGIFPHDETPTTAGVPTERGELTVVREGYCEYDVIVENETTGKKKRPGNATGSNLYSTVVEPGEPVPHRDTFRFDGFSSKCHHKKRFTENQFTKQAYLFARYTNSHGEEGPDGPITIIQIIN